MGESCGFLNQSQSFIILLHHVVGHMCQFNMMQEDNEGLGLVKKPTGFLTNAPCIARRLDKKCSGMHRHITLVNGRAKAAEVYPDKLCRQIVLGLMDQMKQDNRISESGVGCLA